MEIRSYQAGDRDGCRALYAQLVEHHREIYDDPTIGGDDPGAGFDDHLATAAVIATWVAEEDGRLVGLIGLEWADGEATIEPVVVDRSQRGAGVGRALLQAAIDESRRRGASDVNVKPVARNASAIAAFHAVGFDTLGHLQLFMSLDRDDSYWRDGVEVHDRRFRH